MMATAASLKSGPLRRERQFFLYMALGLSAVAMAGFVRFFVIGQSNFSLPWFVHVHGVVMTGWLALYVAQNLLVAWGNVALHRRLGILAAAWTLLIPLAGALVLAFSAMLQRAPPFFPGAFMYAMDSLTVVGFCALSWAGLALRSRPDWHKRLMLGGTIILVQPGLGRLLPMAMLGVDIPYVLLPGHLFFFALGMGHDWWTASRIHPAYYWGLAVLALTTVLPAYLAQAPMLIALIDTLKG